MAAFPPPQAGDAGPGPWTVILAGATFLLQLGMNICLAVWTLVRTRNTTDEKVAEKDKSSAMAMAVLERDMRDEIAANSRGFGETAQALRQKITETELWNRDNFVSKQTFNSVITDMRRSLEQLGDRVDGRFDRLEDKLDTHRKKEFGG